MYDIKKNEVMAIIPARSGSKGIKDKNIIDFLGFPLIAYSIMAAQMCEGISRVIVSTDSLEYAKIAKQYNAEVPFLRPKELAESRSQDIEYLSHALRYLGEEEKSVPEFIVLLRPTTPVREIEILNQAIAVIRANELASAVVSVHYADECPYKWMRMREDGFLESPFPGMQPDDVNLPRQTFESLFIPDGYVDVLKSKTILEMNNVYGNYAVPLLIQHNAVDIDSIADLEKAAQLNVCDTQIYNALCRAKMAE